LHGSLSFGCLVFPNPLGRILHPPSINGTSGTWVDYPAKIANPASLEQASAIAQGCLIVKAEGSLEIAQAMQM
jgi:hypothetical protein